MALKSESHWDVWGLVVILGARFADALMAASAWHRDQSRKGSRLPYLGHLLGVASMVIDAGGSEDAAIAALLHDAIEDQPSLSGGIDGIERRFGRSVAAIVAECSDSDPEGGAVRNASNWRARKQAYLDDLSHKEPDVLLVSLADKLHNARAIRSDLHEQGQTVWERFNAPKEDQLWYYRRLADTFRLHMPGQMAIDLERQVAEIELMSRSPDVQPASALPKSHLAPAAISSLRPGRVLQHVVSQSQFVVTAIDGDRFKLSPTKRSLQLGESSVELAVGELAQLYRVPIPNPTKAGAMGKLKAKAIPKVKSKAKASPKIKVKASPRSKTKAKAKTRTKPKGTSISRPTRFRGLWTG
jgi:hypothetical protein